MGKTKMLIALFAGSAIVSASVALMLCQKPFSAKAEGEESTSLTETSSAPESSSETSGNPLADEDGDGIPDAIEDYYDQHIRDQYMFGIGLGAVIGGAMSVLGFAVTQFRQGKIGNLLKGSALEITSRNDSTATLISQYDQRASEAEKKYEVLLAKHESYMASMGEKFDSLQKTLGKYAKFYDKLDATLNNTVLICKMDELVKKGIAEQAENNAAEVK